MGLFVELPVEVEDVPEALRILNAVQVALTGALTRSVLKAAPRLASVSSPDRVETPRAVDRSGDEAMTLEEVARFLHVGKHSVHRMELAGILRRIPTGGRYVRFWKSDVESLGVRSKGPTDENT